DQPARRQGRRRGGHDRVHARGRQCDHRRAAPVRDQRHHHAVHAGARLAGATKRQGGRGRGMSPAKFGYGRPASPRQAVETRDQGGEDAKVISGGQSLLPLLRLRLAYPELLVDVGSLGGLRGVWDEGDTLLVGALTTHDDAIRDPLLTGYCGLIAEAAGRVADPAVRHRATIGGAPAPAGPAAGPPAVPVPLGATMIARGPGGDRTIGANEFFADYLTTTLAANEILTGIRVPKLGPGWG